MAITITGGISRRAVLGQSLSTWGVVVLAQPLTALARTPTKQLTVWKTPTCGCCGDWVSHLRKSGFEVVINNVNDTGPIRKQFGLADKFGACHTARLNGYVIEGHVPAQELNRLLDERPVALGLAVPGMPMGSPGMDAGGSRDAYSVLLVQSDGKSRIYQSYPSKS